MFCAVVVTEQCQGLILMLLGVGLNTHMHSVFLSALFQQVKQPKTFWCRGK